MSALSSIPEYPGLFIVFEGTDRVGKTTQARLIAELLCKEAEVESIRFPNYDAVGGSELREYLSSNADLTPHAAHLLFSANRWQVAPQIVGALKRGRIVICDRYAYSGVAYSVAKGLPLEWCKGADTGLPVPDIVFYFGLSVEEASRRSNFGINDRHENVELQKKIKEVFKHNLIGLDTTWIHVNASVPIETMTDVLYTAIKSIMGKETVRRTLNRSGLFQHKPELKDENTQVDK